MAHEQGSTIRVYCRSCRHETNHELKFIKTTWGEPDNYRFCNEDCFAQCRGCETTSFVNIYEDFEVYVWDNQEQDHVHEVSVRAYPKSIEGHQPLEHLWGLPALVKQIYEETLSAIQEGAFTLAGLGLRATIEAVCNEQNIKGSDLKTRITSLRKNGLISKNDEHLLHGIRFLGNDAAHEIKKASPKAVEVGLKIVEHLLLTLYLLKQQADGALELSFSSHQDIFDLVEMRARRLPPGEIVTFVALLGSDRRRLLDKPEKYESEFLERVRSGQSGYLQVGKVQPPPDKDQAPIQTYERKGPPKNEPGGLFEAEQPPDAAQQRVAADVPGGYAPGDRS